jgi:hypothetical protein
MSKKQYILHIIENFDQNTEILGESVPSIIHKIRNKVQGMTDNEVEAETNMTVTTTADEHTFEPDNVYYLLDELYYEVINHVNNTQDIDDKIGHGINQLRGLLGVPERFFP